MKRFVIAVLLLACACSVKSQLQNQQPRETKNSKFFVLTPIVKLNYFGCPCINVEIEGRIYVLKLDLGFQGDVAIQEEVLNAISSKTFLQEHSTYGIRGKEYKKKLYQIPKLKIGSMAFSPPILQVENRAFLKDAEFLQDQTEIVIREEKGRLGCSLFYKSNLLIDIPNSQIAFCDGFNTLKDKGYNIDNFVKTPLFLDKGLVELRANTPRGSLHCVLDTGSTWNVLNIKNVGEKITDKTVWKSENISEYPSFEIGGINLGSTSFHHLPIRLPIQIEAILGMEFFQAHVVFLDFSENCAYISKSISSL